MDNIPASLPECCAAEDKRVRRKKDIRRLLANMIELYRKNMYNLLMEVKKHLTPLRDEGIYENST